MSPGLPPALVCRNTISGGFVYRAEVLDLPCLVDREPAASTATSLVSASGQGRKQPGDPAEGAGDRDAGGGRARETLAPRGTAPGRAWKRCDDEQRVVGGTRDGTPGNVRHGVGDGDTRGFGLDAREAKGVQGGLRLRESTSRRARRVALLFPDAVTRQKRTCVAQKSFRPSVRGRWNGSVDRSPGGHSLDP